MIEFKEKTIPAIIKDVDTKKGIVEGYFSTFGVTDSDNDRILPGAYKKTLQERGPGSNSPRIFHLWMHNPSHPLHRFVKEGTLYEDKVGLGFISTVSKTQVGKDALLLYDDGVINEHSVGIQIIKSETADDGVNDVYEVKMWEGSTVTWGANSYTPVTNVKELKPKEMGEEFIKRTEKLTKAIKNGSYSDETFVLLELQLKQIQAHYKSLLDQIQPGDTTGDGQGQPKKVTLQIGL